MNYDSLTINQLEELKDEADKNNDEHAFNILNNLILKRELHNFMLRERLLPNAAEDPMGNLKAVANILYDLVCWQDNPSCMIHAGSGVDYHAGCLMCECLKRIENSGWTRG